MNTLSKAIFYWAYLKLKLKKNVDKALVYLAEKILAFFYTLSKSLETNLFFHHFNYHANNL
jgi:hypothetical protein